MNHFNTMFEDAAEDVKKGEAKIQKKKECLSEETWRMVQTKKESQAGIFQIEIRRMKGWGRSEEADEREAKARKFQEDQQRSNQAGREG